MKNKEKSKKTKGKAASTLQNLKNAKKNLKIVRSSPYASMKFGLQVKKYVIIALIIFILITVYGSIRSYQAVGFMGTISKIAMAGVAAWIAWKIWSIIPAEKKKIEYYEKNPHLINYVPTTIKEDVDDILAAFDKNGNRKEIEKEKEVKSDATSTKEKERN